MDPYQSLSRATSNGLDEVSINHIDPQDVKSYQIFGYGYYSHPARPEDIGNVAEDPGVDGDDVTKRIQGEELTYWNRRRPSVDGDEESKRIQEEELRYWNHMRLQCAADAKRQRDVDAQNRSVVGSVVRGMGGAEIAVAEDLDIEAQARNEELPLTPETGSGSLDEAESEDKIIGRSVDGAGSEQEQQIARDDIVSRVSHGRPELGELEKTPTELESMQELERNGDMEEARALKKIEDLKKEEQSRNEPQKANLEKGVYDRAVFEGIGFERKEFERKEFERKEFQREDFDREETHGKPNMESVEALDMLTEQEPPEQVDAISDLNARVATIPPIPTETLEVETSRGQEDDDSEAGQSPTLQPDQHDEEHQGGQNIAPMTSTPTESISAFNVNTKTDKATSKEKGLEPGIGIISPRRVGRLGNRTQTWEPKDNRQIDLLRLMRPEIPHGKTLPLPPLGKHEVKVLSLMQTKKL
jgi:hypothetical protein